jgi:uncharacterized protein HemX
MDIGQIIIAITAFIGAVTGIYGMLQQREKNIAEAEKLKEDAGKSDAETAEIIQRIAEKQLSKMQSEIETLNNKIDSQDKVIEAQSAKIEELESLLTEKNGRIVELERMVSERDEKIDCLQDEVNDLRDRLEKVERRRKS